MPRAFRSRARSHGGRQRALARRRTGVDRRRAARLHSSAPVIRSVGLGLAGGSVRITPGTNRRLRIFATTQIACTFVLLAGAGMLVATLTALQTANTGYDLRQVLAIDLPGILAPGLPDKSRATAIQEVTRRIGELPGVERVATGERALGACLGATAGTPQLQFVAEGYQPANGEAPTGCASFPLSTSQCSASRSSRAGISRTATARAKNSWPSSTRAWRSGCSPTVTRSTGAHAHQSGDQSWKFWHRPHCRHRRRRG